MARFKRDAAATNPAAAADTEAAAPPDAALSGSAAAAPRGAVISIQRPRGTSTRVGVKKPADAYSTMNSTEYTMTVENVRAVNNF